MKSLLYVSALFVFLYGNPNFADPSEIKPDLTSLSKNVINRAGTVIEENSLRFFKNEGRLRTRASLDSRCEVQHWKN